MLTVLRYRADIDGLRAVAILAVVDFHARLSGLDGGFVGVDVFFVISGFLISGLLLGDLAGDRLSLVDFCKRRILRIVPALFLMLAAVLAVGWAICPPEDYKNLALAVMAAATFVTNFYLLPDPGYFVIAPETTPLLHTWSIGVEEQFYLLFPPWLMAIRRLGARAKVRATVALWAVSFALAVGLVATDPKFAFYMLPTRAWELLSGVLLSMGVVRAPKSTPEARAAALTGLALIGASVFLYHAGLPFPGLAAAPPVLGSALVIWSGQAQGPLPLPALASGPSVYLGKISYPLYLWHFPALGLAAYLGLGAPGGAAIAIAVAASLLLAAASYELVEKPLRRGGRTRTPRLVFSGAVGALVTLVATTTAIFLGAGLEFRIAPERLALARGLTDRAKTAEDCMNRTAGEVAQGKLCVFGAGDATPGAIVWGDSFAGSLLPGIEAIAGRHASKFVFAGRHDCRPDSGRGDDSDLAGKCRAFDAAVLEYALGRPEIRTVILALRWRAGPSPADETSERRFASFTRRLRALAEILSQAGKTVWVTPPLPFAHGNAPRALYLQAQGFSVDRKVASTTEEFQRDFAWTETALRDLQTLPNVHILSLAGRLCDSAQCRIVEGGHPLYFDDSHLSVSGANLVSGAFEAALR